jgi:hypothetical protein
VLLLRCTWCSCGFEAQLAAGLAVLQLQSAKAGRLPHHTGQQCYLVCAVERTLSSWSCLLLPLLLLVRAAHIAVHGCRANKDEPTILIRVNSCLCLSRKAAKLLPAAVV